MYSNVIVKCICRNFKRISAQDFLIECPKMQIHQYFESFPFVPPPPSTLCPPSVTEHVPLHSRSLCRNMARASEGCKWYANVAAPILFLIYVSNIPDTPAEISQFADDFALFYRSKSSQLIQSKLQASLNILIKWRDRLKIKINPAKAKNMLFRNPSKRQTSLSLNINGRQFEEAQTIKFLGITMTPHLNWNEHCKDIATRANKRIFQLCCLSNLNVEQESLLLLYKSWIQPLFLYANAFWLNQLKTVITITQKAQNRALKNCLRKPRWCSMQKLHEVSNLPTIRNIQIRLARDCNKRAQKTKWSNFTPYRKEKSMSKEQL